PCERSRCLDIYLMDVDALAEKLLKLIYQTRMMGEQPEGLAVGMRGESSARRAGLLAPDLLPLRLEDRLGLRAQQHDLAFGEAIGEEQIPLLVELGELLGRKVHDVLLDPSGA